MHIALSGSNGFIGNAVARTLADAGHAVRRLVREAPCEPGDILWDPGRPIPLNALEDMDAVIHLAGSGIADGRWTPSRREQIRRSRAEGTRNLLAGIRALAKPPRAFLCASATGFYGKRGDEWVEESSGPGMGFLAGVCREWEAVARSDAPPGTRVIHLRFGMVLARNGGGLARMLPLFRLGLGGPLGGGRFYVPWIDRIDVCEAIRFLVENRTAPEGPYNLVAPQPVRQRIFAQALGRALRRPAVLPVPGFLLRILYGCMADEVLLQGVRAQPARLASAGFSFRCPALEDCFTRIFPRTPREKGNQPSTYLPEKRR